MDASSSPDDDNAAAEIAAMTQAQGTVRLTPQVKRLIIGGVIMFVLWVAFVETVPHTVLPASRPQPMQTPPEPQAPAAKPPMKNTAQPPAAPAPAPEKSVIFASNPPPAAPAAPPQTPPPDKAVEALQAKVAAQSDAIAALQHQQGQALHIITLMDAYDRLKERVLSGKPYGDELSRLRAVAGNDAELAHPLKALEPYANTGIPQVDALQRSFGEAAQKALHPVPQTGSGIMARIAASLSGFISIRRVGEVPGNTAEAIIARAEAALDRQEVDAAIAELSSLQGLAKQAMEPWLAAARANTARDGLLASLRTAILSRSPPSAVTP